MSHRPPDQAARHRELCRINQRERYAQLKSFGICVSCGQRDAMPGLTLCQPCRARLSKARQLRYAERKGVIPCAVT